jgi:hypothetical protein
MSSVSTCPSRFGHGGKFRRWNKWRSVSVQQIGLKYQESLEQNEPTSVARASLFFKISTMLGPRSGR